MVKSTFTQKYFLTINVDIVKQDGIQDDIQNDNINDIKDGILRGLQGNLVAFNSMHTKYKAYKVNLNKELDI